MANSILTPQIITREALRILHAESNFLTKINRQYDSRFAVLLLVARKSVRL